MQNVLEFEELMINILDEPSKFKFHFSENGIKISAWIKEAVNLGNGLFIAFDGGSLLVWKDNRVVKCRRPSDLITYCELCFSVFNEFDENIGYLYVPARKR